MASRRALIYDDQTSAKSTINDDYDRWRKATMQEMSRRRYIDVANAHRLHRAESAA